MVGPSNEAVVGMAVGSKRKMATHSSKETLCHFFSLGFCAGLFWCVGWLQRESLLCAARFHSKVHKMGSNFDIQRPQLAAD
jgi:hypothetical protein